jgi:hypothetical protein
MIWIVVETETASRAIQSEPHVELNAQTALADLISAHSSDLYAQAIQM